MDPMGPSYSKPGNSKVKEAIFHGFIRKDKSNNQTKIVINIRPRNGEAKNVFSNKDWKHICYTALAAIRAPLEQKNEMIKSFVHKNFVHKNDKTTSSLSNFDNPEVVPSTEKCNMTSVTKMVVKEAIFLGFIRKGKLVIHIKPRNGKAKNVFSNKDWKHICNTVLAAIRAPLKQKNELIKKFALKNGGTTSSLSNLDNPEVIPSLENYYMTSLTKMDINHVKKNKMIKNFDQKNDRTTSSLSNFDNLEAVPLTANCSMTSLTKMVKNHEQKNKMIKNFDQKNDRTNSFLSNFDYPIAVPSAKNYSMNSLTKMDKNPNLEAPKVRKSTRIGRGHKDCHQACSGCTAIKPNQQNFNLPKLDKKPTNEPLERQVKKSFLKILNSVISSPKTDHISVSYSSDTKVQIKRKFEMFEGSANNEASNEASKADTKNKTKLEDESQGQSKSLNNERRKIKPTPKAP